MKHIKNFNENFFTDFGKKLKDGGGDVLNTGAAFLLAGIYGGFSLVDNFISYQSYKKAIDKMEPIYNKLVSDDEIRSILEDLKKNDIGYWGEVEGDLMSGKSAWGQEGKLFFESLNRLYEKSKEILSESEYNIFISSAREIDLNRGKFGSYFTQD